MRRRVGRIYWGFAWALMGCLMGCSTMGLAVLAEGQNQTNSVLDLPGGIQAPKLPGIPSPTLGGSQFWSDQHFFHQWRIQRRANSDEYRLLDSREWQHANGSFEDCLAKLDQIKRERNLAPMQGTAVVLLHGLAAPRWTMGLLGRHLHKQAGYEVFNVEYASTRCSVDDHARSLANVIKSLQGINQINLIGHSMGNVVIRRYLGGNLEAPNGWRPDPRVNRIVMIAPPNHGSRTATKWSDKSLFKSLFGRSGRQLGLAWEDVEENLATPNTEFGIIAGGWGNDKGFSLKLPGDDDGRITVATTRLVGATDFVVVPALHEFIANDPRVFDYTLRFLQDGYFISPEERNPIEPKVVAGRAKPGNR